MPEDHTNPQTDFYSVLLRFEEECRIRTANGLADFPPEVGESLSVQLKLLEHLYRFSSCYWGCHGREHVFEYLGGRCVSSLVAAGRLSAIGYYDECLLLVRSVGEIANLLNLFLCDNTHLRQWFDNTELDRRRNYKPYKVREMLAEKQWFIPFSDEHYGRLCEQYVHPNPDTKPQAHDDGDRPVLGAHYQGKGYLTAHWESCWALCAVSGPIAKLAIFPEPQAKQMVEWTVKLFEFCLPQIPEQGTNDI